MADRDGGLADETRRIAAGYWAKFDLWCSKQGVQPLPCPPAAFRDYVAHLATEGRSRPIISTITSAIRRKHREAGYPAPDDFDALIDRLAAMEASPPDSSVSGWLRDMDASTLQVISDLVAEEFRRRQS